MNPKKKVTIIGGGAAGFFAAASLLKLNSDIEVLILEQGKEVLQKVKVSGGGRCNVTNASIERNELPSYYPRGWKLMRKLFSTFDNNNTIEWYESNGVNLKVEKDNRIFPITNKSQSIIDCLTNQVQHLNGKIIKSNKVISIDRIDTIWQIQTIDHKTFSSDYILIATGSSSFFYNLLAKVGVKIIDPVPSLFTFNIKDARLEDLAGIAVQNASVKVAGTKQISEGPILITHTGLSGPAILKLSSWAARDLNTRNYQFKLIINWTGLHPDVSKEQLINTQNSNPNKKVFNHKAFAIPKRLWVRLTSHANIHETTSWKELGKKQLNALNEQLCNCLLSTNGKSTFKEEFVTCGGVALSEVNSKTLEHKRLENLYFAGEVLDIDAVTGGFNFQAAWTTAYVVAQSITAKMNSEPMLKSVF